MDPIQSEVERFFTENPLYCPEDFRTYKRRIGRKKLVVEDMIFYPHNKISTYDQNVLCIEFATRNLNRRKFLTVHVMKRARWEVPIRYTLSRYNSQAELVNQMQHLHPASKRFLLGMHASLHSKLPTEKQIIQHLCKWLSKHMVPSDWNWTCASLSDGGKNIVLQSLAEIKNINSAKAILLDPLLKVSLLWLKSIAVEDDYDPHEGEALKSWLQDLQNLGYHHPDFSTIILHLKKLATKHLDDWIDLQQPTSELQ